MNRLIAAVSVSACLAAPPAAAGEKETGPVTPAPQALEGLFGFTGKSEKKLRRSASGIACLSPSDCLVAFDEGGEARRAWLSEAAYRAGKAVKLPVAEGAEGDAEAVAAEGGAFFVTGSHAVKRNSCAPNEASRFVVRIAADGRVEPGDIGPALEAAPALKAALGKCLSDGAGLDIEGLAATKDHLWFGFRGPKPSAGAAYVLRVDRQAVFDGGDLRPKLMTAAVGDGRAIRDMQAVDGGLLILAGPPAGVDDKKGYALVLFDPAAAADGSRVLAVLDYSKVKPRTLDGCEDEALDEVKPEGLMVEAETAARFSVSILSDGLCDGGPLRFKIDR